MKKYIGLLLILITIAFGCSSKKEEVNPMVVDTIAASKGLYTYANFTVGASINIDLLKNYVGCKRCRFMDPRLL